MTLRQEQSAFALDVMKLFAWLNDAGYEWTFGEAYRTPEQQQIHLQAGRSKTMNSFHLRRLAIDLYIFQSGRLLTAKEEMQPIGDAWERISSKNKWGGNWSSFVDLPHFERRI